MEAFFRKLSSLSASIILLILSAIFVVLYLQAKPAVKKYGIHFLVDPRWGVSIQKNNTANVANKGSSSVNSTANSDLGGINVSDDDVLAAIGALSSSQEEKSDVVYGGLIPIVGTVLSTLIAMVFAVPIAIYGMWGLFYFGPFISHIFGGSSVNLLVAGLVLGIMIIPFMASLTRDSMKTTPDVLKESAYAMGATKFEVIKDVVFPYAKKGIIGSIILALGRALGETMAVAFVKG